MKMYIAGQWTETQDKIQVLNPFDGSLVDTVPSAGPQEVEQALESATKLTKQLLTFSRGGDPILETVSIGEALEETVEEVVEYRARRG